MRVKTIDEEIRPWQELALRFGDFCRYLWLAPSALQSWVPKLRGVHRYKPRHSLHQRMTVPPSFMRTWHLL